MTPPVPTIRPYSELTCRERDNALSFLCWIDGEYHTIDEVDCIAGERFPDEFKDVDGVFAMSSTDGRWYYYEDEHDFGPLYAVVIQEEVG